MKCEAVLICRASAVYKEDQKRITLCLGHATDPALRPAIAQILAAKGWEHKYGQAPATHMERELQGWLEALLR